MHLPASLLSKRVPHTGPQRPFRLYNTMPLASFEPRLSFTANTWGDVIICGGGGGGGGGDDDDDDDNNGNL